MIKIILTAFIAFNVGMACQVVGTMPESPTEPFEWWIPLLMFAFTAAPALMGYMAGKLDGESSK